MALHDLDLLHTTLCTAHSLENRQIVNTFELCLFILIDYFDLLVLVSYCI